MKDYLQDIVKNTYTLGVIELVKIIGTEKDTLLYAVSVTEMCDYEQGLAASERTIAVYEAGPYLGQVRSNEV